MKKFLYYIFLVILIISLSGCSGKKQQSKEEDKGFDIKKAEAFITTYMNGLMKEDYEGVKKMYTDELKKEQKLTTNTSLKVKGFRIEETTQIGQSGKFKVRVARTNLYRPSAYLDEYTFKVIMDKWNYKINDITSSQQKEAFFENGGIRIRNENNVKTMLLMNYEQLPKYGYSKDDKAQLYKLFVPNKYFNNIDFSYTGDTVAVSTYDKSSFVSIVKIDESLAVQGQQEGGSSGGSGGSGQQNPTNLKEKPIGKEVMSLDILNNSKVQYMTFSPDEKYLVVQYTNGENMRNLKVYSAEKGDIIPFRFEENYNLSNVNIDFEGFEKEMLYYSVTPIASKKDIEKNVSGQWQLSLEDFKAKKK